MTNRRQFISGCSTLALAASLSPTALSAASVFNREAEPEQLSYEAFARCLGTTFLLRRGNESVVALELTRARQQEPSLFESANAPDAGHERFSLMFRGPQSDGLPQNTYSFEHGRLGRFEMFIVPVGVKDERHGNYQAVFNRPAGGGGTKLCLENKKI
jgi:hypothetical protein